ncbi:sulfotransferase 4A1 [Octopus bimaculoides]|uniref:Sulfotransferase domain-containing protein n=1 Tax=Octopus bimaculoides TaxID=37653 RepID=A0A0L8GJI6_OCTBM|nr:sulfotransferase 4A1 [Octopus bimaculoides]XP_014780531.1 sulfotransferase 4A1 [Octopus bimaculoides]XP_014780532.1 sulfotransferase 4A1 [Octopus bimaculoides]XP_052832192.1 sulfotransferase 4A1 [Octopus bimaculoides]|eukprot:XP_014780530.1 PREDICTED: sulfotransferase 4A1-like [Octopus bimaculoides]
MSIINSLFLPRLLSRQLGTLTRFHPTVSLRPILRQSLSPHACVFIQPLSCLTSKHSSSQQGLFSPGHQQTRWKPAPLYRRKSSQEQMDPRIIYMVYASITIGALLLGTILFSRLKIMYKKFVHDIDTYYDAPFGRRQKLIKYKGVVLPAMLENDLPKIRDFDVRPDDVWVVSWPRSGTTWVQEIVYLIHSNLDISQEEEKNIEQRFHFLENIYPGLPAIAAKESPRLIKSHLPFHLLPEQLSTVKPNIIYVVRNPKDILISYYNFLKMLTPLKFVGTFEEFCDRFTKDKVYYSPWGKHVRTAVDLNQQHHNILIVQYEDLHKDLAGNVQRIAKFLGKELTPEQLLTICQRCLFKNMRQNKSVNYSWWDGYGIRDQTQTQFLRQGKVGDWKHYLTPFFSRRVEKMVKDNLTDANLNIEYELTVPSTVE